MVITYIFQVPIKKFVAIKQSKLSENASTTHLPRRKTRLSFSMESGNAEKSMHEQSQEFQGQNLYIWY